MRPVRKDSAKRRPTAGWLGRDGRRALIACLCLVVLFALGAYVGGGAPPSVRSVSAQPTQHDDDLTTGTITFVPLLGDRCRQRLIDNATWRIWDSGEVDCHAALSLQANGRPRQWSAARVDVIRDGFRKR